MSVSVTAVAAATVAMFVVGAVWYMGIFAKQWAEMFGFDKLSKAKQKEMQKQMGPFYVLQILVTIFTAFVLAKMIALVPDYSAYALGAWLWFGIMVPVIVSGVIFGGTEPKWIMRKTTIMMGEALAHTMVAVWVISALQK